MSEFIALSVMTAEDEEKAGREKYTAYFITNAKRYGKYQANADCILSVQGYGHCIVTD